MGKSKKSKQSGAAPGQPKVVCFFCGAEFAEEGLLIMHQQTKHFKCTECSGFGGGRCPTHGCRHKCLVTLSCHWKKDHKGELKTIPGCTKEGRDDPKQFWRVHGTTGTPEDFLAQCNTSAPVPVEAAPPLPEGGLPPIPQQPPMPQMVVPDWLAEWNLPTPSAEQFSMAPLPGSQGDGTIGGAADAEGLPSSNKSKEPDFASQVQAWMAAKQAADEEVDKSQEQAPPISLLPSSASLPISSASVSSDAFQSDAPTTLAKIPEDWSSMETRQSSELETMMRGQEWRSGSGDRQDLNRRSRSRDRSDRAAHVGRRSRSRDKQSSRGTMYEQNSRGAMYEQNSRGTMYERGRQEERMRDERASRWPRDQGRDGNAGGFRAIKITQGHIQSRIWLQNLMSPYGRLEYSHTGNRLNPERDPPWVLFATSISAEDAMNAISSGAVVDGNGVPIKAEWKKLTEKGKGKGDEKDISSRDLYRKGYGRGPDNRGGRDDRRRGRRSTSSSRSTRRNRTRR